MTRTSDKPPASLRLATPTPPAGASPAPATAADDLPVGRLEQAINLARQTSPAQGAEGALDRDVAILGKVYGRLIWQRAQRFSPAALDDAEREALERWLR